MQRLLPAQSAVVLVDVQERLASAMPPLQLTELQRAATILIEAARVLGVPVLATEQYPKGLGPTIPALDQLLSRAGAPRFEKLAFSAVDAPEFTAALERSDARSVVLIGMEAHVCVYQTARDLTQRGYEVHVPIDGVASRRDDHRQVGIALCERAGAIRTVAECVVFDWLQRAGSDAFKEISKLVR